MSVTRRERAIIENINKRLDKLEERAFESERRLTVLEGLVEELQKRKTITDYSDEELEGIIRRAVQKIIRTSPVRIHNHKSAAAGGKAFAQLGATLIDNTNIENEPPS